MAPSIAPIPGRDKSRPYAL